MMKTKEKYEIPSTNLLSGSESQDIYISPEERNSNCTLITRILNNCGFEVKSISVTEAPNVSSYEVEPAEVARFSTIQAQENDISSNLSARLIIPIPGRGTLGVEIPNKKRVRLLTSEIFKSQGFQNSKYDLPVALGKTSMNEDYIFDFRLNRRMLIVDTEGRSKRGVINNIIISLLFKRDPQELKFIMIDPRGVDFEVYNGLKNHFLAAVGNDTEPHLITDLQEAIYAINALSVTSDQRYEILEKSNSRSFLEYNERVQLGELRKENGFDILPELVVVINDYDILMNELSKQFEYPLSRIAQYARACGIFVVLATSVSNTNVITGLIKSNFHKRVAFKTYSKEESRYVLNMEGAERLQGVGDMLISEDGVYTTRVQNSYIDCFDVDSIVKFIKAQDNPFATYTLSKYAPRDNNYDENKLDEKFMEVAHYVVCQQTISIHDIQRTFDVGYNRAKRIIAQLERAKVISCIESEPYEVLIKDIKELNNR